MKGIDVVYKTLSRNMLSRSLRSALAGTKKRISGLKIGKTSKQKDAQKRVKKRAVSAPTEPELGNQTESDLVKKLGVGTDFVFRVYRSHRRQLVKLEHDPKRCSAYLNIVVGSRALDGSLWTDRAVESMFRRTIFKKSKK